VTDRLDYPDGLASTTTDVAFNIWRILHKVT